MIKPPGPLLSMVLKHSNKGKTTRLTTVERDLNRWTHGGMDGSRFEEITFDGGRTSTDECFC